MGTEFAEKAKEVFMDDDFKQAVDFYSKAINLSPANPNYYSDRAQANIKLKNFTDAVADANKAIELDPSMAKSYLRKGAACIKLQDYHTAKKALKTGASLAQDDDRFTKLIKECDQHIAEESKDLTNPSMVIVPPSAGPNSAGSHPANTTSSAKLKYRHEYYQKPEEVVLTIFAKGIPAENVTIDFGEQILSVAIEVPGDNAYRFQPRLFGKILPDKCRYQVLSTKVEIHLAKAEIINWTSLQYSNEIVIPRKINVTSAGSQRPMYPSSKATAKDWDKLEAQVKKEEKEEPLDGDAAATKFFRDIYQNADEDMRRAICKSYVESNGTVLSTDWEDVGSKKVEGSAPDGMELRKWEY